MRGALCQRFACPISDVVCERVDYISERQSAYGMNRLHTRGAQSTYVLWRRGSLYSSAANKTARCSVFERSVRAVTSA